MTGRIGLHGLGRRVVAGLCAAFLLAVVVFSSAFVTAEADHDCTGQDCPICLEVQNCLGNFQLLGSAGGVASCQSLPTFRATSEAFVACAYRAPSLTLQRLDVRFDE